MIVTPIKTSKILPGKIGIADLLDTYITKLSESQIVVITSKIIALCENRVISIENTDREELIRKEADLYLPANFSKYNYHFTIKRNTLAAAAGIDESNSDNKYVLWPNDPQKSANEIRAHLQAKFSLEKVGVIITDSISQPMRLGTTGVAIGYSGLKPTNDYRGKPDLFGKEMAVTRSNVVGGLAAAAVLAMGEGTEQTPLCVINSVPFVNFCKEDPSKKELSEYFTDLETDLFAPMIKSLPWQHESKDRRMKS